MVDTPELEDQDQAEVLDETNLTLDGEDIANFDTIPDVYDATSEVGDADEDEPVDGEIETDEDVEAEQDADLSPRTRLEDRAEREPAAPNGGNIEDQVRDEPDSRPGGFEGGG
jgi:hypothetical protein